MRTHRVAFAVLAVLLLAVPALCQKQVSGTYSTWDADLINSEGLTQTGAGVYVAVLDTGLLPNWRDYFPQERIAANLGIGFVQEISIKAGNIDPCGYGLAMGKLHTTGFIGSDNSSHGTHVASTIIGYNYRSNADALNGYVLPPIYVKGIAPNATIIPVKVLSDYNVPALPKCGDGIPQQWLNMGTWDAIAAGINYVTSLKKAGYSPMVINMSLGGGSLAPVLKSAIDDAVANGVVVVASAGNNAENGMGYPGAYPPVISAGAAGWVGEWIVPGGLPDSGRYRMWWLKYPYAPVLPNTGNVADPTVAGDVYVADFSSRAYGAQQLDVLAPGSWVRGPFPEGDGYSHLPWWSKSIADLRKTNLNNFYLIGGTSMASPHVAAAAALLLEKDSTLTAPEVETILKTTALPIPANGSVYIRNNTAWQTITWRNTGCTPDGGTPSPCDPVGAGLIQIDAALAGIP